MPGFDKTQLENYLSQVLGELVNGDKAALSGLDRRMDS